MTTITLLEELTGKEKPEQRLMMIIQELPLGEKREQTLPLDSTKVITELETTGPESRLEVTGKIKETTGLTREEPKPTPKLGESVTEKPERIPTKEVPEIKLGEITEASPKPDISIREAKRDLREKLEECTDMHTIKETIGKTTMLHMDKQTPRPGDMEMFLHSLM
eukprot:TRINITY_DN2361_c1_g1_i1.p1 TRINITY_DN2361_c1_g1~~TRINITY_DN2361_c1_g1_i1.p1  ORF type:complete len:166 (+),score=23.22 TRINITY_DN2361_c1_g1_i1:489-986(+)